jgi:hypothetical protein
VQSILLAAEAAIATVGDEEDQKSAAKRLQRVAKSRHFAKTTVSHEASDARRLH